MTLKIGIIIGSTRPGRHGEAVARWVFEQASERIGASYELIDLLDYDLPHYDEPGIRALGAPPVLPHTIAWAERVSAFDGFVFVTPEYNHSVPSALKAAIDFLNPEWHNKAAGFVSYGGSAGGARAIEHLRLILAELQVATVRTNITLPFFSEFTDQGRTFSPGDHQLPFLHVLFDQVEAWSRALQPLRKSST